MNPDRTSHRTNRIALYADWLQHDADGLAFNVTAACPAEPGAAAILTTARDKLRGALDLIETAIATDKEITS